MPTCVATLKKNGVICGRPSVFHEVRTLCGIHHRCAMKDDQEYSNAWRIARRGPDPAVAAAELRAARVASNERKITELQNASVTDIMRYSRRLITLWFTENIGGFELVKAYTIIRYHSILKEQYKAVLEAAVRVTLLGNGYHPDHTSYSAVPLEERTAALERLTAANALYGGEIDYTILSRQNDAHWANVQDRIRRVEAEEVAARREAERIAFQQRLRQEAVVFQRDPEGGIDLRAFANDKQSVHRSSVQNSTERAVHSIISRPMLEAQETLAEIYAVFNDKKIIRWDTPAMKESAIDEITSDYANMEAFNIRYGKVLDHVWSYISIHEHGSQLCVRLAQEVLEGIKQCSNGKMARLVNVLRGFDDTLDLPPSKEELMSMFQNKIARLAERPLEERRPAAALLFEEYTIPESDREAWLAPLLDQ